MVFPTNPMSDFLFHNAKNALNAAFSKRSSPVSLLRVPNSSIKEPAPAVPKDRLREHAHGRCKIYHTQVSRDSPNGTPCLRLSYVLGVSTHWT